MKVLRFRTLEDPVHARYLTVPVPPNLSADLKNGRCDGLRMVSFGKHAEMESFRVGIQPPDQSQVKYIVLQGVTVAENGK